MASFPINANKTLLDARIKEYSADIIGVYFKLICFANIQQQKGIIELHPNYSNFSDFLETQLSIDKDTIKKSLKILHKDEIFVLQNGKIVFTEYIRKTKPKRKPKKEVVFTPPTRDEVRQYVDSKGFKKEYADTIYDYYDELNWHDAKGNKVVSWRLKINSIWLKNDEYKKTDSYQNNAKGRIFNIKDIYK